MNWLTHLITDHPVAYALLILSLVALSGLALGNIRIGGIELGIAGVLFSGIAFGHFGCQIDHTILEFSRDFGLVLFVYTVGMQVGPGFLTSLRKQGLPLNLLAIAVIVFGGLLSLLLGRLMGFPIATTVGLFSGATTNTPALGAAQEALKNLPGVNPSDLTLPALAYAAAYPFGIMGIILTMLLLRAIFRIDARKEAGTHRAGGHLERMTLEIKHKTFEGTRLRDLAWLKELSVVVTRFRRRGEMEAHTATPDTVLRVGDTLLAVGARDQLEKFSESVGHPVSTDLMKAPASIRYDDMVVTRSEVIGKTVDEIDLFHLCGVAVSRVTRAGIEMTAVLGLKFQFGDQVRVVGEPDRLRRASAVLGNSVSARRRTPFIPVFIGIALGVFVGSCPVQVMGMAAPVSLGLAGGPLVMAIVLSRIGRIGPLIWYMPQGANFALRELGIVLFLSCVGLKAGGRFVEILLHGDGLLWMGSAAVITFVPLFTVGLLARLSFKYNFMDICGLLAGTMTDPPALAFANSIGDSDAPSVAYATVYPLTMLLRILVAQLIVLFFH